MNSRTQPDYRSSLASSPRAILLAFLCACFAWVSSPAASSTVAWGNNNNFQSTIPSGLSNVTLVAAGTIHSLALRADGTVAGWGDNLFGQTNVTGLSGVAAIAGGDTFSLALLSNGTVVVRGTLSAPPAGLSNVVAIAAGWHHALALRQNGTVVSWGDSNSVPAGLTNVIAIAAGDGHSLALLGNRTVRAWGNTSFGKTIVPAAATNVVAITAGKDHCVALRQNGTLVAWGNNSDGQGVIPATTNTYVAVSAGAFHNVGLLPEGKVFAWGSSLFNQTNSPTYSGFIRIAAGGYHNLGVVAPVGDNPPVILVQPYSQAAPISKDASFSVMAVGAPPLSYQWQRNGTNLIGKTSNILSLPNVQPANAGTYTVVITNANGVVVSTGAILTPFYEPPSITAEPQDVTKLCGENATFAVTAQGFQPLSYQWSFGGTPLSGATKSSLSLTNVLPDNAGAYSVEVTNIAGVVTSAVATLTVTVVPPDITEQPEDVVTICGEGAEFHVTAHSQNPLSYQWLYEGAPIANATNTSLVMTNVLTDAAGHYSVLLTEQCSSITSAVATLTVVVVPPEVTSPPQDATIFCGQQATFQVTAFSRNPLSYQWLYEGAPIPGATNTSLNLSNVMVSQAGRYSVLLVDQCASITSSVAVLTVLIAPTFILQQPQDVVTNCGDNASFQIAAYGLNPLSYQWLYEGAPIPNATNTGLNLFGLTTTNAGHYSVLVYDQCMSLTSSVAVLTVSIPSNLVSSAVSATATQGQFFSYTITAEHSPIQFAAAHLPYGLSFNSTNAEISGVPHFAGTFYPLITAVNACTSHTAVLTLTVVSSAPVITSPDHAPGIEDQPFSFQIEATNATSFGAYNLPPGLSVDPTNGLISGSVIYGGTNTATIFASNEFGTTTMTLFFDIGYRQIFGLSIANMTFTYSPPYLLDFEFSVRDNDDPDLGNAIVFAPPDLSNLTVEAYEGTPTSKISASETGVRLAIGSSKSLKVNLVLDFTSSLALADQNDTNHNDTPDSVDSLVSGAHTFVNQQAASAQIGVFEFHREDFDPQQVVPLTTDKTLLNDSIAGIWTNYVQGFPASSRCWDALLAAITDLGTSNRDEQHYVVFISDGYDESSLGTVTNVIDAALAAGVKIYCIGFGGSDGPPNMTDLANITTQTHGRYYEATQSSQLAEQFSQISKDLYGQYIVRWATLKRTATPFQPYLRISYTNYGQPFTYLARINERFPTATNVDDTVMPPKTNIVYSTNFFMAPYIPTEHTGTVTLGALRMSADAAILPTAITLRTAYTPRFVRQLRLHYHANWPCVTSLLSTNRNEILYGWSMTETNDGSGGKWLLLSSSNTTSLASSIPFAAFGGLVHFDFQDVVNPTNAFQLLEVDNALPTYTGGQKFTFENTNEFITIFTNLPYGTPVPWLLSYGITNNQVAAELEDPDGDGIPTWQEYLANTDPLDPNSHFAVRTLTTDEFGRYQITFRTALNRRYRVETSTDLVNWEVVETNITGVNADVTVQDQRYIPWVPAVFYRAVIY